MVYTDRHMYNICIIIQVVYLKNFWLHIGLWRNMATNFFTAALSHLFCKSSLGGLVAGCWRAVRSGRGGQALCQAVNNVTATGLSIISRTN